MLDGADVLVTGGTGTFGQAMVRHLLALERPPRRVIVLSRDELKQSEMARQYHQDPEDRERLRFFIGDVRDESRLYDAFRGVDYVIHAAAMKQVPACEYNPAEAIRTNVGGALSVVRAAIEVGVKRVIALSTDKAVNPVNLYGATKLAAEKLFVAANALAGSLETRFSCVRYGNVLGSRGSVLQVWRAQLAAGEQLTMTDPRMTRFWITIDQAVEFVLERLASMAGAEIFVPKLPSVTMGFLADALAGGTEWARIPVRQGEKMHETLIGEDESRNAWEFEHHYELVAEQPWKNAKRVGPGFSYTSANNGWSLTVDELRQLLGRVP